MTGFAVILSPILSLAPAVVRRPSSAVCFTVALSLALVSSAFGQVTSPAASLPGIGQGNAPAQNVTTSKIALMPPASPAPMPVLTDEAKDGWWISETIAQSRKDQPVFFGVRLANAPQAALAETYKQFLAAGEKMAVRLWGCNDLPMEFKGRVQVTLKQGDKQFAREDKTVRLAPETVKRLAKYSFDTEDLAAGQYALVTSLFNNEDELVQQQVTTVIIRVTQKQDLSRRSALAKAEAKAKKAELKAKADLSRRSALAKREAEKQAKAEAKAQAKAVEKAKKDLSRRSALAKREAELKAKAEAEKQAADLSRRSALAKRETKAAEKAELKAKADLSRRSALAKRDAEKQAAAESEARAEAAKKAKKDLSRRSALAKRDAELKAKAEAEKQAADLSRRSALAKREAEAAKKAADQKLFEDTKAKCLAQEKAAIAVKAAVLTRQETEYQAKVTQAEADQQIAESQAAALALAAKTAQAEVAAKEAAEMRAKQVAKQDAPKDVKAKRVAEAKAAEEAREQAAVTAKAKAKQADAAKRIAEDKAEATSDAKAALVKQHKNMAKQNTAMKAQAVKNAERQAKEEIKANQVAAKAKHDAEIKAKADLSRRSALAKREADKKAAADLKARAKAAEKAKKDLSRRSALAKREAELKAKADLSRRNALAKAEAEKQAADLSRRSALAKREADLAKKAADKKIFEDTKAKYMVQEKSAIAVKAAVLTRQETEYQAKVTLAEADQQVVETQAAALALKAKTAQANLDTATTLEKRMKQIAKQDAPKDVKAKRAVEAKAAGKVREQAAVTAKAKAKQADAAKRIAEDKAEVTSDAKAVLVKQRKNMAKQNTKMEAQAVKNAERQAKEEIKANEVIAKARHDAEIKAKADLSRRSALAKREAEKQAAADLKAKQAEEAKVAREVKVKARIEARSEVTVTGQPATDLSRRSALAKGEAGKPVAVTSKDLEKEKWRVAVGMLYRQIGAQRFKTGSYSASYVGKKSSHDHWVGPAGGLNDAGNRIYDDGYVGSDDYTDLDSGTWNWGYDDGQQVKGNTIEFTGVDEIWRNYSRQTTVTEAESSDNADYRGGLMVEADRYLAQTRFVDYGVSFGLSRAQTFQASANGMNNFNDYQEWATYNSRVLDTYDITGLGITPDSAPYHGNRQDEGPVIDTSPVTRQSLGNELVSAGSCRAFNSISESLDMDLSTLSLGMSIKGNYRRVYVVGAAGPTLNMLEKDATYEETLYESNNGGTPQAVKYWSDSSSGTECLFGYYVQAEVGVRIYRELHLGIFGRYDWLENVSGNVGPSSYEVNPAGGSMGGTIGLHF